MGELLMVETSLRGPCEPAPAPVSAVPAAGLLEASRSLISTGMWDGCCAVVDERGCEAWAWPAPDVSILLLAGGFLRVDARCWPGQVYRGWYGGYGLAPQCCRLLDADKQSISKDLWEETESRGGKQAAVDVEMRWHSLSWCCN